MTQPKLPTGWWLWRTRASEIRSVTGKAYVAAHRTVARAGIVRRDADRHARLGPRRRLLPDLPGPLRPERPASRRPGRSRRGTRRRRVHGFKGGDLFGVAERLDELADLGVTALYLTPIFSSASNHRYHAYDYLTVDPLLGGDAALRELLDAAHARGMRVILDGVFNHCGRGFWPFHHVLENGAASPYRDWFHLDPAVLAGTAELNAYPDAAAAGRRARRSATGPGGACRRCPSSTSTPADARVPARRRRALAPLRDRRLAARRPRRDRRPRRSGRSSAAAAGR